MISFSSASVTIKNYTMDTSYNANDIISGTVNVSIVDEDITSEIKSNFNQSMLLIDFLDSNGVDYDCSSLNCIPDYSYSSPETEKLISVAEGEANLFGFVVTGNNININDLSFSLSSDFDESSKIPLSLKIFNKPLWNFSVSSDDYSRSESYGCYDTELSGILGSYKLEKDYAYCEKISFPETSSVEVGAILSGNDNAGLVMKILDSSKAEKASCTIVSPASSCIAEKEGGFSGGEYYVCIKPASVSTNYSIVSENRGTKCGWYGKYDSIAQTLSQNSTADYAIFARVPTYASANSEGEISIDKTVISSLVTNANLYLQQKYNKNCSSGCVLPVSVSGINQNLMLSNPAVSYSSSEGSESNNKFYTLLLGSASFSFSGVLDLSYTEFEVFSGGNKTLTISLGSSGFSKTINVLSSLLINGITPTTTISGIPAKFTAYVDSSEPVSYSWDFGDNNTEVTANNSVYHKYANIGIYTLTLTAESNNFSESKSFEIYAGSPEEIMNLTLSTKKQKLNHAIQSINVLPLWYQKTAESSANIEDYQEKLDNIEEDWANAESDEQISEIFSRLVSLNVPYSIAVTGTSNFPIYTDLESINPQAIADYAGNVNEDDLNKYKNPILQWQKENIEGNIRQQDVSIINSDGTRKFIFSVYNVNVKSNSEDDGFFVIDKNFENLNFNDFSDAKKSGSFVIIELASEEEKSFEFFTSESDSVFFVSPKLGSLELSADIGACNFNKVCEKDLEENSKNCRSDCKPIGWTVFYIILIIVGGVLGYLVLQMWYKARYETFLFKDRKLLFNLLMFISNARARRMEDKQIDELLRKQKWSEEQINYAIKKSKGQRTGMYEIIPIEKLFAYKRDQKAKQNINASVVGINKW